MIASGGTMKSYFRYIAITTLLVLLTGCGLYFLLTASQPSQTLTVSNLTSAERSITVKDNNIQIIKTLEPLPDIDIQASSAIVMNADNGDILFSRNSNASLPIASMSKMMTELLVLEAIEANSINWQDTSMISDYAYTISNQPGYASVHLTKEQSYTVRELFNAMAITSANGATIALAEMVAGSEKEFVAMMNEKANELGLEDSYFVNTTGLNNTDLGDYYSVGAPTDTNKMSAKDVAILAKQLIKQFPNILQIMDEPMLSFRKKFLLGDDFGFRMVRNEGVDGLKTGYTDEAGFCFAGTVEKDDIRLISVVMGTSTIVDRFSETKRLYETAFDQMQ